MEQINRLKSNMETVIIGKSYAVSLVIAGFLSQRHILIEDIPGVGKTTLAHTLAKSIDCQFKRVQFTPDLLPSDILGVSVFQRDTSTFKFQPGPIFTNILLVDEINRATPRLQAALLEAMAEAQVTIDGKSLPLPSPFLVMATQNPVEYEGTFPLPESQMDRFSLSVNMGYLSVEDEAKMVRDQRDSHPINHIHPVLKPQDIIHLQNRVKNIKVDDQLLKYLTELVAHTRQDADIQLGVSPRGSLDLYRIAQAWALMHGRDYIIPDDIKSLAIPILAHRLVLKPTAKYSGVGTAAIIERILQKVPVPL